MNSTEFTCFDLEQAVRSIAAATGVTESQVRSAIALLEDGNTLPFIARYRKEATSGLDETALRMIEDALAKAHELARRKATILRTIDQQGLLTPELRQQIEQCQDKQVLEDLYLPFKPKRRTRATAARERGLQPLADLLLQQRTLGRPRSEILRPFVSRENDVPDEQAALQGACDIVAEQWSEDVETRRWLSEQANGFGRIHSQVKRGKKEDAAKFEMYFDHQEPVKRSSLASPAGHAARRGRRAAARERRVGRRLRARQAQAASGAQPPVRVPPGAAGDSGGLLSAAAATCHRVGHAAGTQGTGGRRSDPSLHAEPPRVAAVTAGWPASHDGDRPGLSHRMQGRRGRRHGQVPGQPHHLSHAAA